MSSEDRVKARHVSMRRPSGWAARYLHPSALLQWALVLSLVLFLWPASFGGRFGMVIVAGNSMEPTYELGDAVFTWREPVEVGDITLYQIPEGVHGEGNPVIHRVVGGDGSGWVTQGDNSVLEDEWLPTDQDMLGVAKFKVPAGGYLLNLMRTWWFVAILGGLAVGLLLWPEVREEEEEELAPAPVPPPRRRRRGRHKAPNPIFAFMRS